MFDSLDMAMNGKEYDEFLLKLFSPSSLMRKSFDDQKLFNFREIIGETISRISLLKGNNIMVISRKKNSTRNLLYNTWLYFCNFTWNQGSGKLQKNLIFQMLPFHTFNFSCDVWFELALYEEWFIWIFQNCQLQGKFVWFIADRVTVIQ